MPDRLPNNMFAVHLIGYGGPEKLIFRTDVPLPVPEADEVLIRVLAAGINNTDINTRLGWYAKGVTVGTNSFEQQSRPDTTGGEHASWSGAPMVFPRIQGADCCGVVVAVGSGVSHNRIGERVVVRNMLRSPVNFRPFACWTFGSECDGGFAQYAKAPARDVFAVDCNWSDTDLASIPCAYSTAENMLHRAKLAAGETVLVTGASGGVGSAAVQLAKRRGAEVIAISSSEKAAAIQAMGADRVIERDADPLRLIGARKIDVVIDIVGGAQTAKRFDTLKPGGRYAVAGAIAGPMVELDLRDIYLRDISILGCTFQEDIVFDNLIGYIESNEIKPLVAKTYPLSAIAEAQQDFVNKGYIGKLVLVPPQDL